MRILVGRKEINKLWFRMFVFQNFCWLTKRIFYSFGGFLVGWAFSDIFSENYNIINSIEVFKLIFSTISLRKSILVESWNYFYAYQAWCILSEPRQNILSYDLKFLDVLQAFAKDQQFGICYILLIVCGRSMARKFQVHFFDIF